MRQYALLGRPPVLPSGHGTLARLEQAKAYCTLSSRPTHESESKSDVEEINKKSPGGSATLSLGSAKGSEERVRFMAPRITSCHKRDTQTTSPEYRVVGVR